MSGPFVALNCLIRFVDDDVLLRLINHCQSLSPVLFVSFLGIFFHLKDIGSSNSRLIDLVC